MKFDTLIIGGGLSGLTAGISLARAGKKVAIITSGQSALHFSSGSFGLLSTVNGKDVKRPLEEIDKLNPAHPYRRLGAKRVAELAAMVPDFMDQAGITMNGTCDQNHYRITPIGLFKPAWLSTIDCAVAPTPHPTPVDKTAIVGIKGFLDFYPGFLNANLYPGNPCHESSVTTSALDKMRHNSTEMRAPGIAKLLKGDALVAYAKAVKDASGNADTVIIPAVTGLSSEKDYLTLENLVGKRVACIPTHPISVPGMRIQMSMRRCFESLGGTYLLGDNVTKGNFDGDRLTSVDTANLGEKALEADSFILATGSFFSQGLVAEPSRIFEPLFNCDVNTEGDRADWFAKDIFEEQKYMSFGVKTDDEYRVYRNGTAVSNLYASGSILGGCNSLKEGSGAGVAILTALEVAQRNS